MTDEMFGSSGHINDHWQTITQNIQKIGRDGLASRLSDIKWHLAENGVTYNVYSESGAHNRLWSLDPLPLVISNSEWHTLENKLVQRAELLNFILKDLYGERKLIKHGLIPAEIIFANKNFIRQCNQITYKTSKHLLTYAADLARGPDGNMWVVNDKTGAPSGMGYALENRMTIGRTVPDLYDGLHVKRLSNFFDEYKKFLHNCSPRKTDDPLIVILTPGPLNETYFEHAYLANYLGYPLVQGSDLVTRMGFVWLKSLRGLKQVDVIIRRVDDAYCDPLELKNDSKLGVAGLLNAQRQGNVAVVNPVGTTILENPALLPFLPNISKAILGKDLALHQVASWWCGQPKELSYVLENLHKLVIRVFDDSSEIYLGHKLSRAQLEFLREKIKHRPYAYVGQEMVSFSTSPTFSKDKIEPRNTLWRTFAIADEDGYKVMPGGLVRVAPQNETECISNQSGSGSKDVWILTSADDIQSKTSNKNIQNQKLSTNLEDLPSLTAENLFWVGRYTARVLMTARFIRTLIRVISDANHYEMQDNQKCQTILCQTLTHMTMSYPGFLSSNQDMLINPHNEILSLIFDKNKSGSIAFTISMLKNSNYAVKNLWSSDAWRVFEKIVKNSEHYEKSNHTNLRDALHYLDELIMRLIAFSGLVQESIAKEQGLIVFLIGNQLEESLLEISKTRAILTFRHHSQVEYELLEAYLNSFESLNTYRYSYKSHLQYDSVVQMMIFSPNYPKSLLFKINQILELYTQLPKKAHFQELTSYEKPIFEAFSKLKLIDYENIFESKKSVMQNFDNLLYEISGSLASSSNNLTKSYFSHN